METALQDSKFAIAFNLELEGLIMFPPASQALAKFLWSDTERALSQHGVLLTPALDPVTQQPGFNGAVVGHLNSLCGYFSVTDLQRGLSVLADELKRIGLLDHSEIGWYCQDELIWRRYRPKNGPDSFVCGVTTRPELLHSPKFLKTMEKLLKCFAAASPLAP